MSILRVESVHKAFRQGFLGARKRVLRGVSLELAEGEVYGFLGHNGAGKSTTMKLILGLGRPDSGRITVFGGPADDTRLRRRIGFLSEEVGLYLHLSAEENLRLVGELHRMRRSERARRIDDLLEAVGLSDARGLKVKHYSKGMRQRLGLAAALIHDPDLLLLDEPYSGLDPVGRRDLREVLVGLKAQGKTIMLSSHIVPDVEAVCDRVGILSGGTVARELDLRKVFDGTGRMVEVTVSGVEAGRIDCGNYAGEHVGADGDRVVVRCPGDEHLKTLVDDVYARGGAIVEVRRMRPSLEEVFVEEIGRHAGEENHTDSLAGQALVHNR